MPSPPLRSPVFLTATTNLALKIHSLDVHVQVGDAAGGPPSASLFLFSLPIGQQNLAPNAQPGVCMFRLRMLLVDVEQRMLSQDASKRKDMSEVNKRNIKANMQAVTGKVRFFLRSSRACPCSGLQHETVLEGRLLRHFASTTPGPVRILLSYFILSYLRPPTCSLHSGLDSTNGACRRSILLPEEPPSLAATGTSSGQV